MEQGPEIGAGVGISGVSGTKQPLAVSPAISLIKRASDGLCLFAVHLGIRIGSARKIGLFLWPPHLKPPCQRLGVIWQLLTSFFDRDSSLFYCSSRQFLLNIRSNSCGFRVLSWVSLGDRSSSNAWARHCRGQVVVASSLEMLEMLELGAEA